MSAALPLARRCRATLATDFSRGIMVGEGGLSGPPSFFGSGSGEEGSRGGSFALAWVSDGQALRGEEGSPARAQTRRPSNRGCSLLGWRSTAIVGFVRRSEGLDSPRGDPSSPRAPLCSIVAAALDRDRCARIQTLARRLGWAGVGDRRSRASERAWIDWRGFERKRGQLLVELASSSAREGPNTTTDRGDERCRACCRRCGRSRLRASRGPCPRSRRSAHRRCDSQQRGRLP